MDDEDDVVPAITTKNLNHLGIVAATLRDNRIGERIDFLLGEQQVTAKVTLGQCVSAMILNGLGFANRALYLVSRFFIDKPVDILLGRGIEASDLNDDTLGKALDIIADYDQTRFFADIAFPIALELKQVGRYRWIDSTSFSLEGDYDGWEGDEENPPQLIRITHGFSKAGRPDLKQVMMSLVMVGPAGIPIWAEPQDGNSSDKKTFHEIRRRVNEFAAQFQPETDTCWVADSVMYSKDKLLSPEVQDFWITRVPETITEAKKLVTRNVGKQKWEKLEDGYEVYPVRSKYGGVDHRWLLIFSAQAYEREMKTFTRNLVREKEEITQALWHLSNEEFTCEADALKKFREATKKYRYHRAKVVAVITKKKYHKKGRPGPNEIPDQVYCLQLKFVENKKAVKKALISKGRFILATNDLNEKRLPDKKVLTEYKNLQRNERGFRMLKDPWFLVDKIYLKTPNRIAALMSVMALTLLVYNLGQYKLRENLKAEKETLPNQLDKEVSNPTLRWVFQLMTGVAVVTICQGGAKKRLVANLNSIQKKIVNFFGPEAMKIYGLWTERLVRCGSG